MTYPVLVCKTFTHICIRLPASEAAVVETLWPKVFPTSVVVWQTGMAG